MKIIPKFAGGGSTGSFFTVYQATQTPQIQAPTSTRTTNDTKDSVTVKDSSKDESSSKKESSDGKLTEKELFSMIKDVDAMPNEMRQIIASLKRTMQTSSLLGYDSNYIANMYLNALYKIKIAKQNKDKFNASITDAKANGSLGETAISMDGQLFVQNEKGTPVEVSVDEYLQNKDKYHLLTNSNLAYLRQYDPKFAFMPSDDIFNIINNGVGFESFQKLIKQGIESLGNTSYTEKGLAGAEALQGLKLLQGKSSEEKQALMDKTKGILSYEHSETSNIEQLKALKEYLVGMLPERVKVWAATKLGMDKDAAITHLVEGYLAGKTSYTKRDEVSAGSKGKEGSGNSSEGSGSDLAKTPYNTPMKLLEGVGVQHTYVLNPETTRAIQVQANILPLTDSQDKPIGANKTLTEAISGNYNGILDIQHATLGGQRIDPTAFGGVIVTDGKIASVDFPCIEKPNGDIVPNTDPNLYKAKQNAERELKQKGIDISKKENLSKYWKAINLVYKKYGLPEPYNESGQPINGWRRFGVINVAADSHILGMGDLEDNPFLREITDDTTVDNLIALTKDDKFNKKGIFNRITGGYDRFYRGTMWIPIDVNAQAASVGLTLKGTDVYNTEVAQQAGDARRNWVPGHSI